MHLEFLELFKALCPFVLFAPRTLKHDWNYMGHVNKTQLQGFLVPPSL